MAIRQFSRTPAVLAELGHRIERLRLQRNQTQADLAAAAGIGTATLQRLETGANATLATLIQVLRALGRLGDLDTLISEVEVSPFEISGARGTPRQRASGAEGRDPGAALPKGADGRAAGESDG